MSKPDKPLIKMIRSGQFTGALCMLMLFTACGDGNLKELQVSSGVAGLFEFNLEQLTDNDTLLAAGQLVELEAAAVAFNGFDLLDSIAVVNTGDVSSAVASEVSLVATSDAFIFGDLRTVRVFIQREGEEERLLASLDTIPSRNREKTLEIRSSAVQLKGVLLDGGREATFSMRSEWVFREDIEEDFSITLQAIAILSGEI